jgi:hypothetical protein
MNRVDVASIIGIEGQAKRETFIKKAACWYLRGDVLPKRRLTFNGMHDVHSIIAL